MKYSKQVQRFDGNSQRLRLLHINLDFYLFKLNIMVLDVFA